MEARVFIRLLDDAGGRQLARMTWRGALPVAGDIVAIDLDHYRVDSRTWNIATADNSVALTLFVKRVTQYR